MIHKHIYRIILLNHIKVFDKNHMQRMFSASVVQIYSNTTIKADSKYVLLSEHSDAAVAWTEYKYKLWCHFTIKVLFLDFKNIMNSKIRILTKI